MNCGNCLCNQGRECPHRESLDPNDFTWSDFAIAIAAVFLIGVVVVSV